MPADTDLKGLRVAVTGGTSGLGLALVRQLTALRRARRLRRPHARRTSSAPRDETGAHGIVGDVGRKDDIYPIALQITRQPRRARRADQQRLEPRPGRRWRCSPTPNARSLKRRSRSTCSARSG